MRPRAGPSAAARPARRGAEAASPEASLARSENSLYLRAFAAGKNNMVTADGLLKLLRLISDGRAYSPEVSGQLLEILLDQRHRSGIPAGLPGGAAVAHKTGNISTVERQP